MTLPHYFPEQLLIVQGNAFDDHWMEFLYLLITSPFVPCIPNFHPLEQTRLTNKTKIKIPELI